ncbi:type-1 angiotensin II receptor-associated protein [Eurytemora carolleeae]|uniref:type-1 angiotensin II receptor-associated protein n=1 Tax=Eurytemora carolleeae TaxID=1294199 RepID=UPI000C764BCB|nr:type-1 angiotensin II receptor-associated protein [Eurytemora carolleeae]|eukprot:XP_023327388.1 type-1 angiotensin II receptor-associated protein-like [Eurytemora affinis]
MTFFKWNNSVRLRMGYKEFKLELPAVKSFKMKLIFLVHFTLLSWGLLHPWAPEAYEMQGYIFLFLLIWTLLETEGVEHVLVCLAVNIISILLDIIIIAIYFPSHTKNSTAEFSGVMAIFNLIFRVYSSYVLYTEWCTRTGSGGVTVVDSGKQAFSEGGSVRSGSVLAHYPGGPVSPRLAVHTVHTVHNEPDLHSIPPSFTVIN